jgi:hypothetical protein
LADGIVLLDSPPKIMPYLLDLHENLIKVKGIAITLMPAPKSPGF